MTLRDDIDGALDDPAPADKETEESAEENEETEGEVSEEETESEDSDTDDTESEDDADDESEDGEDDDDTDDLDAPVVKTKEPSIVTRAKKEFPEFAKKFPQIMDNYFLATEFKKVHATIEDARLSAEKSTLLDQLAGSASEGNIEPLLDLVYEQDPAGLKQLVHNFLPTLRTKAPKLFADVVKPVIHNVFAKINANAEATGNKELALAVKYCLKAITGKTDVPEETPMRTELRKVEGREVDVEARDTEFYTDVDEIADPILTKEINIGLDPDEALPEGLRETLIEKIKNRVYLKLKNDPDHMQKMAALRRSARQNRYSREYVRKVAREVVNAAKELIPSVRKLERKRMLGDKQFVASTEKKGTKRIPDSTGKTPNVGGERKAKVGKGEVDWNKGNPIRAALDDILPS